MLPFDAIKQNTTTGFYEERERNEWDNLPEDFNKPFSTWDNGTHMDQLLKNEKENLKLVFEKLEDIGGIPIVTQVSDLSNTLPDEKVVITLVAYLNIRLMDLSQEIRAARVIQLAWRNRHLHKQKKKLQLEIKAAKVIQKYVREFLVKKKIQRAERASLVIQSCWRRHLAKKEANDLRYQKQMQHFANRAITIQAVFRGYVARARLKKMQTSAVLIQKIYRGWIHRSKFLQLKSKVIFLQQYFRALKLKQKEQNNYQKIRNSIILLQAQSRGWLARQELRKRKEAIVKIQSFIRQVVCRKKYLKTRCLVTKIQQRYKGKLLTRKYCSQYQRLRYSVIKIQRWYRSVQTTKNKAATLIQAFFRRIVMQKRYLKAKNAVIYTQRQWRTFLLIKNEKKKFLTAKKLREERARQLEKIAYNVHLHLQAICIQRYYRQFRLRKRIEQELRASIAIQHWFRGRLIRLQYLHFRKSICLLQRHYRSHFQCKDRAAACIQSHVRSWLARKQFHRQRVAVTKIQAAFRCYAAQARFKKMQTSAVLIQKTYRGWVQRSKFLQLKSKVTFLQRHFRAVELRRKEQNKYRKIRNSVLLLQRHVRGWFVRKTLKKQKEAATKIQSFFRQVVCRRKYLEMRRLIVQIQLRYKGKLLTRKCCSQYQKVRSSTIKIQRWYRSVQMTKNKNRAATLIQTFVRRVMVRKRYLKAKNAIIFVQRQWRTLLLIKIEKKKFLTAKKLQVERARKLQQISYVMHLNLQAICIQRYYRQFRLRKKMEQELRAAIMIQHWFRGCLVRLQYLHIRKNICLLQRELRSYFQRKHHVATCIQSLVRSWLVRRKIHKQQVAVTKIQALWRAYKVRSSVQNKQISAARERIKTATANATEDQTLHYRTKSAIDFLLKYQSMYQLLCALSNLDVATRLSPKCCETLANSGGVEVIIQLIQSCNRSVPHMEAIKYSVNVLLNISKYDKTVQAVWDAPNSVDVTVEMMKIFREKGSVIFTKCSSLLWILCQEPHRSQVIKENVLITKQLVSIHYLVMRKKKIDDKNLLRKSKMSAASATSFLCSSFTLKPKSKKSLQIQPDWILGNTAMREYTDPVAVISAIMETLKLKPKLLCD